MARHIRRTIEFLKRNDSPSAALHAIPIEASMPVRCLIRYLYIVFWAGRAPRPYNDTGPGLAPAGGFLLIPFR